MKQNSLPDRHARAARGQAWFVEENIGHHRKESAGNSSCRKSSVSHPAAVVELSERANDDLVKLSEWKDSGSWCRLLLPC